MLAQLVIYGRCITVRNSVFTKSSTNLSEVTLCKALNQLRP
jgi:hypothetical protein